MKVLLLEDDLILNEIIEEFLQEQGFIVDLAYDGEMASSLAYENLYDLLILDVNVPKLNGFDFLKELRKSSITTPAIFITSLNSMDDMQKGFDSGCDDYIKKPFELKELELRIGNLKRRFNLDREVLQIDKDLSLDIKNLELNNDGIKHKISNKEEKILSYFVKNSERIISMDELISNIWSLEEYPSSSTIRTYIKNIRKMIGDEYIENIKGVGYRFNKK